MKSKECACGGPLKGRVRHAPTGPNKRNISILARTCRDCGQMFPVFPERLTYWGARWIYRWNRYQRRYNEQFTYKVQADGYYWVDGLTKHYRKGDVLHRHHDFQICIERIE